MKWLNVKLLLSCELFSSKQIRAKVLSGVFGKKHSLVVCP